MGRKSTKERCHAPMTVAACAVVVVLATFASPCLGGALSGKNRETDNGADKQVHLGHFSTAEAAEAARMEYGGRVGAHVQHSIHSRPGAHMEGVRRDVSIVAKGMQDFEFALSPNRATVVRQVNELRGSRPALPESDETFLCESTAESLIEKTERVQSRSAFPYTDDLSGQERQWERFEVGGNSAVVCEYFDLALEKEGLEASGHLNPLLDSYSYGDSAFRQCRCYRQPARFKKLVTPLPVPDRPFELAAPGGRMAWPWTVGRRIIATGDILLYESTGLTSYAIKAGTRSKFTHVSLAVVLAKDGKTILRDNEKNEGTVHAMEVTNHPSRDVMTGITQDGFQIHPLAEKLSHPESGHTLYVRKMTGQISLGDVESLSDCMHSFGTRYEKDLTILARGGIALMGVDDFTLHEMFCSDFVAWALIYLGAVPPRCTNAFLVSKNVMPSWFAPGSDRPGDATCLDQYYSSSLVPIDVNSIVFDAMRAPTMPEEIGYESASYMNEAGAEHMAAMRSRCARQDLFEGRIKGQEAPPGVLPHLDEYDRMLKVLKDRVKEGDDDLTVRGVRRAYAMDLDGDDY